MKVVTYSHARNALKSVLDGVQQDADVTIISRRAPEGDAVVMSLDYYNSMIETLHLLFAGQRRGIGTGHPAGQGGASPSTGIDCLWR